MLWDERGKRDIDLGRIRDFREERGLSSIWKEVVIEWMHVPVHVLGIHR